MNRDRKGGRNIRKVSPYQFKGFLGKLERFTSRSIPVWVILLTIILILENPFWIIISLHEYEPWIGIADGLIVLFFVLDLVFKWYTVRHWKQFLKLYWLDILAVFPFYLIARVWISVRSVLVVGEEIGESQRVLHEFLLLREGELIKEARLAKEAELLKETRPFIRALRSAQRFLRFIVGAYFKDERS